MSLIPTSRDNWLIGIKKYHANPVTSIHISTFNNDTAHGGKSENETNCDHGYRGHSCMIEPISGHCATIGKLIKAFFLSFGVVTKIREKMLHHIKITGIVKIPSCQNIS